MNPYERGASFGIDFGMQYYGSVVTGKKFNYNLASGASAFYFGAPLPIPSMLNSAIRSGVDLNINRNGIGLIVNFYRALVYIMGLNSRTIKDPLLFLGLILFGLAITFGLSREIISHKKLKSDFKLGKAKIVSFEVQSIKNTYPSQYEFYVNGKSFLGDLPSNSFCKTLSDDDKLIIKKTTFDVVYFTNNPSNSELLTTTKMYNEYMVNFPNNNELSSILETYFNCKWSFWRYLN